VSRRRERLAEEIREEVASLLGRGLKDPRIGFVTVTRVELTADLALARIYVGVLGDEAERKKTLGALAHSAGFVRRELGRRLRIRITPQVEFKYDSGLAATERVAQLLAENPPAAAGGQGEPEAGSPGTAEPDED
jgi:ribosome-binding factor A